MPKSADIRSIIEASERVLRARLEAIRAAFHHNGLKGAAVEESVRDFFREFLPDNIGVSSGIVIDHTLSASNQIDVVLYDKARTPTFFNAAGAKLFPIECVYFAVEIKTCLTPGEFDRCVENMDSFKKLDRSAFYSNKSPIVEEKSMFGRAWAVWQSIYLVFSLESQNIDEIRIRFLKHRASTRRIEKQIDTVFCLDRGFISNAIVDESRHASVDLLPTSQTALVVQESGSLLSFLSLFSTYYNQAEMGGRLDLVKYTGFEPGSMNFYRVSNP